MSKKDQLMIVFSDVRSKMIWLNGLKMKESLKGYKSSEIHCIDYIGSNTDSNVTKLAESFFMTRGAITKMTQKLIKKGTVESYQKPDNKKEIYFRLTKKGQVIYKTHEQLHAEFNKRDNVVFKQITEEQFKSMMSFLESYRKHLDTEINKLGISMKPR